MPRRGFRIASINIAYGRACRAAFYNVVFCRAAHFGAQLVNADDGEMSR